MLQINSWLNQPGFANRKRRDGDFEMRLNTLRVAVNQGLDATVRKQLWDLEQTALDYKSPPSRQQQARFFFLGGYLYGQANQKRMSHQYYGLCERRLQPTENSALLVLHMAWAPVSEAMHYPLCTLHSYGMITSLLQARLKREANEQLSALLQSYEALLMQCRATVVERSVTASPPQRLLPSFEMPVKVD
jgi:hypothetical protein